ncbi:MAG: hypothetical protein HDR75_08240 [Bacteroides sp.]|nr:hypothetical protein [Bacteroides sp.]
MKQNIENLSIIFTVRVDSQERLNNILATLAFYDKYTDCPLILLEADTESRLSTILEQRFPALKYVFIFDDNPIFHRTHYINEEFKIVETQNAAVIDSDVVVPIEQLKEANKKLTDKDNVMVYPYDGRFVGHDAYFSDKFRETIDPEIFDTVDGNQYLMFGFISVGGAFLVNVNRYRRFGWENEYFPGWGPEDFEREHRLDILGHKPQRIDGKIHHLHHPRGINSSNLHEPLILATKREYCKVCSMLADELKTYVSSWPWLDY